MWNGLALVFCWNCSVVIGGVGKQSECCIFSHRVWKLSVLSLSNSPSHVYPVCCQALRPLHSSKVCSSARYLIQFLFSMFEMW